MKTIKVIDLIEKCLKKDKTLPIKIKYAGVIYELDYEDDYYFYEGFLKKIYNFCDLYKSVEIIEEDKEIEDTKYMRHHEGNGKCYIESKGHKYYVPYDLLLLIDDLVKAVNELKKGK